MLDKEKITGGKWEKYYNLPEIQDIRHKIIENYTNKLIFLEEPHEYYLEGVKYMCVSDVTHLFKPIDSEEMAEGCVRRWQTEQDPSYKYYGMTKEEILAKWKIKSDNACEFGTSVHEFGESMFYYMTGQYDKILDECVDKFDENGPKPSNPQEEAIVKFWNDLPECFVPVLAETKVFNSNGTQYAGTFDILFYYVETPESPNNGLVIFDYKGLDVNVPILTKNGWKTMGTVKEGDIVFDGDGNETKIIHTSDVHYKKCYKVFFDNGASVVADAEHNWQITFTRLGNEKKIEKIMTTEELFDYMNTHNRKDTINIPRIKTFKGINSEHKIEIDPYVLGVWLGDGHSSCGMVTNMYSEIFDEIESRGFELGDDVSKGGAGKAKSRTVYGLSTLLKKYNLINNKHIPFEYLLASRDKRLEALKGFMDTDGTYNKCRKRFILSTTRKKQAYFSIELLSSLGIKSTLIKCIKNCNNKKIEGYDVAFTSQEYPFLKRKIQIEHPKCNRTDFINIKKICPTDTIPTRCIQVDSLTHTFVFGREMIITHNTNEDLYKNFKGQTLLEPFDDMLDMNVSYYTLQLSLYAIPLQNLGMNVIGRRLIWVRPDGNYEKVKLESVSDRLRQALNIPSKEEIVEKKLL
jgi:hypothetical protein